MLYEVGEQVYLNRDIITNRYPRGDIGINDIKNIFANNIKGFIHDKELPSFFNGGQFLYTVKIFENLYAIEVTSNKLSYYPLGASNGLVGFTPQTKIFDLVTNQPINIIPSALNNISQYNQISKLNYVNSQIQSQYISNQNLNTSKSIQKTISKYYYYKIVDEWLYKKLFHLLAFIEIHDGKTQLIKSMSKYSIEKLTSESDENIDLRIGYLEKNIITKKIVNKILKKIVKRMCFNWYELNKHEQTIAKVFLEYFKDLLETSINRI